MNEKYLVLSEEERAKGFVRPVRKTYVHVGRRVCGKQLVAGDLEEGKVARVCMADPGHDGDCGRLGWKQVDAGELRRLEDAGYLGGCGVATTMALPLAETYARKPDFYGATYCCGCGTHLRVGEHGEFVWDDGELVGT